MVRGIYIIYIVAHIPIAGTAWSIISQPCIRVILYTGQIVGIRKEKAYKE